MLSGGVLFFNLFKSSSRIGKTDLNNFSLSVPTLSGCIFNNSLLDSILNSSRPGKPFILNSDKSDEFSRWLYLSSSWAIESLSGFTLLTVVLWLLEVSEPGVVSGSVSGVDHSDEGGSGLGESDVGESEPDKSDICDADFDGAVFDDADFNDADFNDADVDDTDVDGDDFNDADADDADVDGDDFNDADADDADFNDADADDADDADFNDADFNDADVDGADFNDPDVDDAELEEYRSVSELDWVIIQSEILVLVKCCLAFRGISSFCFFAMGLLTIDETEGGTFLLSPILVILSSSLVFLCLKSVFEKFMEVPNNVVSILYLQASADITRNGSILFCLQSYELRKSLFLTMMFLKFKNHC